MVVHRQRRFGPLWSAAEPDRIHRVGGHRPPPVDPHWRRPASLRL